ncbi:MAG: hypothetical protein V1869_01965 [Candidatus Omnitrophota bacterium]
MEQKAKLIVVGLAIFSLACLFLLAQTLGAKQDLAREKGYLKTENSTLNAKMDKLTASLRGYENRITSLAKDLEDAAQQKSDLEKRLDNLNRAKDDLAQKLKLQGSQIESSRQSFAQQEQVPQADDSYWGKVLRTKSELELQLSNLRNDFRSLQIANEQALREKGSLELDFNSLKRENADLKRQIDYNQELTDRISQELAREKKDKKQIQDSYKTVKNENVLLSRQLQRLNSRKVSLEEKLQELQVSKAKLEEKFSQMETTLTGGAAPAGGLKEKTAVIKSGLANPIQPEEKKLGPKDSVDLPAIVVRSQAEPSIKPENRGNDSASKVLAVNRENNFVIVGFGRDSGLKSGDTLKIYRGDRAIAVVEATQVRKDIAACDIKREADPIKIGDVVLE